MSDQPVSAELRVSRLDRWRNRLATRLFRLIATRAYRERVTETWMVGIRYRAHRRRHALGFADDCDCKEVVRV